MRILSVDDKAENLYMLEALLRGHGHIVDSASDGRRALQLADRGDYDLIISDILMPRMDGYRLCQEVRKCRQLADVPFIFYTSTYTSLGDEKLALDCGGDRYIKKPAPLSTILMALLELMEPQSPRPRPSEMPEELLVMREYTEALVRKLEERNAKLERAREEM